MILNQMKDLETKLLNNAKLKNQLNDSNNLNNEQQNKMKDLETLLQKQFNEQLQNQFKYTKELEYQVNQLQNKLTISEKEIFENNKLVPFEGQIVASVEKELLINAEINLIIKHGILFLAFNVNQMKLLVTQLQRMPAVLLLVMKENQSKLDFQYKLEVLGAKCGDYTGNGENGKN